MKIILSAILDDGSEITMAEEYSLPDLPLAPGHPRAHAQLRQMGQAARELNHLLSPAITSLASQLVRRFA